MEQPTGKVQISLARKIAKVIAVLSICYQILEPLVVTMAGGYGPGLITLSPVTLFFGLTFGAFALVSSIGKS